MIIDVVLQVMKEHNARGGGISRSRDISIYLNRFNLNDDLYLKGFKVLDLLISDKGKNHRK